MEPLTADAGAGRWRDPAWWWAIARWGVLVGAALLPILLLSLYAFRIISRSVRDLVEANNRGAATMAAELVSRDLDRSRALAQVFARLPGLVQAAESHDADAIRDRLSRVVESYPGIDRAFVTDAAGVLWSDYPVAPESLGRSFAERDWYRGLSRHWQPYISEVYQRHAEPRPLVVAVAAPIYGSERTLLGALVYQYRLDGIAAWLRQITVGRDGEVYVLDHKGTLAAHPRLDLREGPCDEYADLPMVAQARAGGYVTAEYLDPLTSRRCVATFMPVPVGSGHWVVVAQQPVATAYEPIDRLRLQLALAAGILALGAALVVGGLGHSSEHNRRLSETLIRERNLLRNLIDNLPDHIYVKDRRGRYLLDNIAHARFVGVATPADVVGKSTRDFFPAEIAAAYQVDDEQVFVSGEPILEREELCTKRNGQRGWLLTTKVPLRDAHGQVIGLVCISRDITARKQAEQQLERTATDLKRSNAELEQFAYVASHDLQEPLRMVSSYLQLLEQRCRDRLDANGVEFLHYAVDGAVRMRALIRDLLEYSRIGRRGHSFEPTDCGAVVARAMANLQAAIAEAGAKVEFNGLPTVSADPGQLTQLFQNLIGNAIKFHGDEPPRVRIEAVAEDGHWKFAVRDNGIGIDPQYGERIFVIFQRLHGRDKYPGTGIGLAICKKIVERHGGRIWVESQPGHGATFHFTLANHPPEDTPV